MKEKVTQDDVLQPETIQESIVRKDAIVAALGARNLAPNIICSEGVMNIKRQIRTRFLNFLKHYFNPLTRRIAQSSSGPFAIVRHVGRRSGKQYETPIIVQPADDGFVIELTYGPEVDWFKNVLAAGGCTVFWHGKDYVINKIKPLDTQSGMSAFPLLVRTFLRIARRQHFVKMMLEDNKS